VADRVRRIVRERVRRPPRAAPAKTPTALQERAIELLPALRQAGLDATLEAIRATWPFYNFMVYARLDPQKAGEPEPISVSEELILDPRIIPHDRRR
jgi:hypothetical protein